jgi:hypothetical protein
MEQHAAEIWILLRFALWGMVSGVLFVWLRRAITPTWVRGLFESEKEPSIRLVLAAVVTVFALCMVAAGRINEMQLEALLAFVGSLLFIGSARLVGKAFAQRPAAPPAQIKANKAEVNAEGDANITTEVRPQP